MGFRRAFFLVCWIFLASSLAADTVYLKSGGKILDCRVESKDARLTYVRTPSGRMGVPTQLIQKIEKQKSIFDVYDEKRKSLSEKDPSALYKLAMWCRKSGGFRKEMVELLENVIALSPNNVQARHLLGYIKVGSRWKQLPPLSVHLTVETEKGDERLERVLREQLDTILKTRKDIQLAKEGSGEKSWHTSSMTCSFETGGSRGSTFFGVSTRGASSRASVKFQSSSAWLGKTPRILILYGELQGAGPNANQHAVMDALNRDPLKFHSYLDSLLEVRVDSLEAAYNKPKA